VNDLNEANVQITADVINLLVVRSGSDPNLDFEGLMAELRGDFDSSACP
jgi:hypothetical protein